MLLWRVIKLLEILWNIFKIKCGKECFTSGAVEGIKRLVSSVGEAGADSQVSLLKFDIGLNLLHCS